MRPFVRPLAYTATLVLVAGMFLGQATPTTPRSGTSTTQPAEMPTVPYFTEPRPEISALPQVPNNPKSADDLRAVQDRVEAVVKYSLPATVGVLVEDGQGSGVIVSKDGYVLTAGHVSGDPNKDVTVVFSNGPRVRAKALGANNGIDSGMVKIITPAPAGGYPYVPLGSAKSLIPGQWAIAMGHPGGYRPGRPPVVRLGRVLRISMKGNDPQYIQTDCPLINGDSGGPVFDLDGRLIGINSRIGVTTNQNLHVPIDTFVQTWTRLADAEKWDDRPSFLTRRITPRDRQSPPIGPLLGVVPDDSPKGALVFRVRPGTPAEGRLLENDVITRINGQTVRTAEEFTNTIAKLKPDDVVKLDVLRGSQTRQVEIRLAAAVSN